VNFRLNTYAEFGWVLVAGVHVKVDGRAMVELVAGAQLAAHIEADSGYTDSDGSPSHDTEGNAALTTRVAC
jgi:hypothetical protein